MIPTSSNHKPVVLCILDGWGIAKDYPGNAITRANPVNFNKIWFSYPHTLLEASGRSVGLPDETVGNSEVGHINIGAGRVIFQDVLRIDTAITDGSFFKNEALEKAVSHSKQYNSQINLIGLVGPGSVHSKTSHLIEILELLQSQKVDPQSVKIHLFTDGRDSPPSSAKNYLADFENFLKDRNLGKIASITGRYYAMDRDNHWDRTEKAYNALTGKVTRTAKSVGEAVENSYFNGITDEFIEPVLITNQSNLPSSVIKDNDSVIFFNFRPDRAKQLTKAFILDNLSNIKTHSNKEAQTFKRNPKLKNLFFVTLTEYEKDLPVSAIAFLPKEVTMPIARVLSQRGLKQLHIAETEKYAHVTYFFNGGRESQFFGEDRILIDSKKVASFDQAPAMSCEEITTKLLSRINSKIYDFVVVNFANADMVGHTGNFEATIKAVQAVDFQLGIITKAVLALGGVLIVTADHGNAEEMISIKTGEIDTEHNANPAPCIIISSNLHGRSFQLKKGVLADIAPTILDILKIPKPSQMTGRNLLE